MTEQVAAEPAPVVICYRCQQPEKWMALFDQDEILRWFSFCQNRECGRGPRIIRELHDPELEKEP